VSADSRVERFSSGIDLHCRPAARPQTLEFSASIRSFKVCNMINLHPKLTTVGSSVDDAAHLASRTRDRLGQQWQKRCCDEVYRGSIDEEGYGKLVSIARPTFRYEGAREISYLAAKDQ
jgi:hypothetical protein